MAMENIEYKFYKSVPEEIVQQESEMFYEYFNEDTNSEEAQNAARDQENSLPFQIGHHLAFHPLKMFDQ
jgi:hypothetical protein